MIYLLLLLQQLISSSTHLVAKNVTLTLHPTTVVLIRGLFTCVAFGIYVLIRRSKVRSIDREDIPRLLLLGLINMPINQLLFIWGVKYTTAPNASLAYALTPAFVVIILLMFRREHPGWKRMLGVVVAFVGAAIVLVDRGAALSPDQTLGNIMVLGASMSWAGFTVLGRPIVAKYGPIYATALTFFAGLALYIPVWAMIPIHDAALPLTDETWLATWSQLFYLGVITSGIGYALWYYALNHMDAGRVAVFNNLQPIITSILALIIFGTEPTPLFLVGGVIALIGVILTQRG
ncbi:MAG: EamA family transporter [Ignavibacteria bacterium]|nr:EamA family transporter [Ignavibacteria bacterium]MBP6510477.1 EamA family transporter [Candidatus Kapabacteria bacterium]MBK6420515.1 EamA family transporter [Ignavibacteria bacterium]MBK6761529.1 EamA family transporter [Ignavibacteria bacterium]MBK7033553.1 EamA family transporter [Ignavibacteria bacterium]